MKSKIKVSIFTLLVTLFSSNFLIVTKASVDFPTNLPFMSDKFLILDSKKNYKLPPRFRIIEDLNISGTAQFRPSQIDNIKVAINDPKITIIDLRQESHGFFDDSPIRYYSFYQIINNNLNSSETENSEEVVLSELPLNENIPIFKVTGEYLESIKASIILNEHTLCNNNSLGYKRFAVKDNSIPTPETVDDFISFIKNIDDDIHLLFHCDAGDGRTTMFMAMYQMMKNERNLSLSTILNDQITVGGIVLTDNTARATFLEYFYNYTLENKNTNFETNYSSWLKNITDYFIESAPLPEKDSVENSN
ncbi:phosphatase [Clostridium sp. AL.422]|uniref:phosphatase domain-containing putative toxin n=1 Tax=Clostridium TaxID=1485 RepID=UPI00293DE6D7|nr:MULTISPECIES: phosphatase [unclassified Clostridium]MDV4151462.1 phosphatase [Clostridium sp. AL.422]